MVMSEGEPHELPAVPSAVAAARAIVDDVINGLSLPVRDDAALLVSELMSNAVRHGGATAILTVTLGEGYVTVELHDDGAGRPQMPSGAMDPSVASGRGLRILERVAAQWGVQDDREGSGKTVWFRLATDQATATAEHDTKIDKVRENRTVWS